MTVDKNREKVELSEDKAATAFTAQQWPAVRKCPLFR